MKIIAKVDNRNFLVQIHEDEVANLLGYNSSYGYPSSMKAPDVGVEIKVTELFKIIQLERQRPQRLEALENSLHDAANAVAEARKTLDRSPIIVTE